MKKYDIPEEEVRRMYYEEGMSQQKIADYYGVSRGCIYGRLYPESKKKYRESKLGIETRKRYFKSEEGKAAMKRANQSEAGKARTKRHAKTKKRKDSNKRHRKIYNQSGKGIIYKGIRRAKRRELGFIPLNEWFEDGEWHHYDREYVICMPAEIHQSIIHNIFTGQGMDVINKEAFEFLDYELREEAWSKITGDWRDDDSINDTHTQNRNSEFQ